MKKKFPFIAAYWWCMILFVLGVSVLFLGNHDGGVSVRENRTLSGFPKFSLSDWFGGTFSEGMEGYLSDQMPWRDSILKVSARVLGLFDATTEKDRVLDQGMIETLDEMANGQETEPTEDPDAPIVILTESPDTPIPLPETPAPDAPVETAEADATPSPTPIDPSVKDTSVVRKFCLRRTDGTLATRFQFGKDAIEKTAASLNAYRGAVGENGTVVFTYIPYSQDANEWLLDTEHYSGWSSDVEPTLQANVDDGVYVFSTVSELEPHMQAGELCYFKTDHHWAGLGAFYVQRKMMQTFGVPPVAYEDFSFTVHEKFAGSIASSVHSLAGFGDLYDRLEVPAPLSPARAFVYRNVDQLVKEVRYMEPERVVYAAFLGGTHSPFYVAETGFHTGHGALVICDSFGLAFVPFIAPYYDRVCLADLRDTHSFVTQGGAGLRTYIEHYGIDDVYFIVSRGCGINNSYMQKIVLKYLG